MTYTLPRLATTAQNYMETTAACVELAELGNQLAVLCGIGKPYKLYDDEPLTQQQIDQFVAVAGSYWNGKKNQNTSAEKHKVRKFLESCSPDQQRAIFYGLDRTELPEPQVEIGDTDNGYGVADTDKTIRRNVLILVKALGNLLDPKITEKDGQEPTGIGNLSVSPTAHLLSVKKFNHIIDAIHNSAAHIVTSIETKKGPINKDLEDLLHIVSNISETIDSNKRSLGKAFTKAATHHVAKPIER